MSIYQSYFLCDIFLLYNCFPAHLFRTCFDVVWAKIIQLQDGWIAQSVPGCHSVLLHIWQGPPSICRAWHNWKYGKHHTEQVRVAILFLLPEWGAENWCAFHTFNIFTPLHLHLDIFDKKVCSVGMSGSNLEYFEILLSSLRQLAPHSEVEWVKKMGVNVWRLWCLTKTARNLFKDDHLNLLEEEIQKQRKAP